MTVETPMKARPIAPEGAVWVDLSATAFHRYSNFTLMQEPDVALWMSQQTPESYVEVYLIFPNRTKTGAQYGYRIELLDRLEPDRFRLPPQGVACQPVWTSAGLSVLLDEECYV